MLQREGPFLLVNTYQSDEFQIMFSEQFASKKFLLIYMHCLFYLKCWKQFLSFSCWLCLLITKFMELYIKMSLRMHSLKCISATETAKGNAVPLWEVVSWLGEMQFVADASPVLQRMVGSGSGSGFQPCAGLHAAVRCCWTPVLSLPSGFLGTHVPALNILSINIFPSVLYT